MPGVSALIGRVYATLVGYLALGHEASAAAHVRFARSQGTPLVYDANFAHHVRAERAEDIEAALAATDRVFAGLGHRQVVWDPGMPAPFEARLALDGYRPRDEVELLLEGDVGERGPGLDLRPAETDGDWRSLLALHRLDHEEDAARGFHAPWDMEVTEQIVAAKRAKTPALRFFMARVGGTDCACLSAWPGDNGVGKVEDLFTHPAYRGRGIATALIAACVDDARARGAGPVLIGARPEDTPKHMYAALGFRPICVSRSYLRVAAAPADHPARAGDGT